MGTIGDSKNLRLDDFKDRIGHKDAETVKQRLDMLRRNTNNTQMLSRTEKSLWVFINFSFFNFVYFIDIFVQDPNTLKKFKKFMNIVVLCKSKVSLLLNDKVIGLEWPLA